MKQLLAVERYCLIGHLVSMAFGLAGLLLVMPHPEFLAHVPAGQTMFTWSMAGGGVVYILLGAIAVSIYAYRTLGLQHWLMFLIPSVGLSLTSELLGTSTGFPFGHYSYLSGLGYKVAGLVPFTIPLSWYYLGLSCYLLARAGLGLAQSTAPVRSKLLEVGLHLGAIATGSLLLTSWDFVLDPAMSQTAMPFWYWHVPGAFFGMPYQNFAGWFGTGVVFMSVTALLWLTKGRVPLDAPALTMPFAIYLGNFAFAMIMSLASGIWVPVLLGLALGVAPAVWCWQRGRTLAQRHGFVTLPDVQSDNTLDAATTPLVAPVSVTVK